MVGKGSLCILILLSCGALFGAPQESLAIQELRLALENIGQKLHSQQIDMTLFHERMQTLEALYKTVKQEFKASPLGQAVEKRVATLEKAQEAIAADLKTLKNYVNETASTLSQCQNQLAKIDKQLNSDIQFLKSSLNSMLALLQPAAAQERAYTVQSGDSLGQIALEHKTTIKALKELNNLSTDIIYVGQKIILP